MSYAMNFAPQVKPHLWMRVNGLVCAYSAALLIINTFFTDDSKGVRFSQASYLYYSWITTVIWATSVGLELGYERWEVHTWERRIEFLLAILFTASSLAELWEWKLKDQNIGFMEIDILANMLSYAYETRKSYFALRQGYHHVDESTASASLVV